MAYVQVIIILVVSYDTQRKFSTSRLFDYPIWVINKAFKEFQSKQNEATPSGTGNDESNNMKNHLLILPYKGSDIMHIISSMQKQVTCALPDDIKMMVSYTGKKLSICFNVKDKTAFHHEHDIVYYCVFSSP